MLKKTEHNKLPFQYGSYLELYSKNKLAIENVLKSNETHIDYLMQDTTSGYEITYRLDINHVITSILAELSELMLDSTELALLRIAFDKAHRHEYDLITKTTSDKVFKVLTALKK